MNNKFKEDYCRSTREQFSFLRFLYRYFRNHHIRYLFWGRNMAESKNRIVRLISRSIVWNYRRKYGIEIDLLRVGGGLRLIHPWMITVNKNAEIGSNATLYKGCTIGEIIDGAKKGNPVIGDNVTIYANATVCGNITIGNNCEISSGAFVNFDVPDDSIVIGNPGVIHKRRY